MKYYSQDLYTINCCRICILYMTDEDRRMQDEVGTKGFSFFRKKFQLGTWNHPKKNISEPGIPNSELELGTIRKFFPDLEPVNSEPWNLSGFSALFSNPEKS